MQEKSGGKGKTIRNLKHQESERRGNGGEREEENGKRLRGKRKLCESETEGMRKGKG